MLISRICRNFNWAVTWEITKVCNLRCHYCLVPKKDTHPDIGRAVNKVIALKPKLILITGGEPLLVPGIAQIIQEIKNKINTYVIVNTNATLLKQLIYLLPYIEGYSLSIDGLGAMNEKMRGVNGNKIIEHIDKLANEIKIQGFKKLINIATVITRHNYWLLPMLAQKVNNLIPAALILCIPMIPYNHPESIASDFNDYNKFVEIIEGLVKEGVKIRVSGPFSHRGQVKEILCYRQYFRTEMHDSGSLLYCKPKRYIGYFLGCLSKAKKTDFPKFLSVLKQIFNSFIIKRYDCICPFPCGCDDYIEPIFFNELWKESYELILRVPDSEFKIARKFITRYINPEFDLKTLIAKKSNPESISLHPIFYADYQEKIGRRIKN